MFSYIFQRIKWIWYFVITDFKVTYRFKTRILAKFFDPFVPLILFLLIYSAVFNVGNVDSLGFITKNNFGLYVLGGFLSFAFMVTPWGRTTMLFDKYYQTLEGLMLAPMSRFYLLASKGVRSCIEAIIGITPLLIVFILTHPDLEISWTLILGIIMTILGFIIILSIDFIITGLEITNEGLAEIFRLYGKNALLFFGCVYYPIEAFPSELWIFIYINPVFHIVDIIRMGLMGTTTFLPLPISVGYVLFLSVLLPFLAVKTFNYIFSRYSIQGY